MPTFLHNLIYGVLLLKAPETRVRLKEVTVIKQSKKTSDDDTIQAKAATLSVNQVDTGSDGDNDGDDVPEEIKIGFDESGDDL